MDYKPKFPVSPTMVGWEDHLKNEPVPPVLENCDRMRPGQWLEIVERNKSLRNQFMRNQSFYFEVRENPTNVVKDGAVVGQLYYQLVYPPYDPTPGYELHQPLGNSCIFNTSNIE